MKNKILNSLTLAKSILIVFLLISSCKKFSDKKSSSEKKATTILNEKKEKNESLSKVLEQCKIQKNKTELALKANKTNSSQIWLCIANNENAINDCTKIALEDFSSINLLCGKNDFTLRYYDDLGNNFQSTYHKFKWDETSNSFFLFKVYNATSNRHGISINGSKLNIPFNQYALKKHKIKTQKIYSFSGFQEEKEPLIDHYLNLINLNYNKTDNSLIDLFGDEIVLKFLLNNIELTNQNVQKYNDIAYYLGKSKANKEAIFLLEKIVELFPKRTVAHINIGDAYWDVGEKQKAKESYKKYLSQMKSSGKEDKIPTQILKRINL